MGKRKNLSVYNLMTAKKNSSENTCKKMQPPEDSSTRALKIHQKEEEQQLGALTGSVQSNAHLQRSNNLLSKNLSNRMVEWGKVTQGKDKKKNLACAESC